MNVKCYNCKKKKLPCKLEEHHFLCNSCWEKKRIKRMNNKFKAGREAPMQL